MASHPHDPLPSPRSPEPRRPAPDPGERRPWWFRRPGRFCCLGLLFPLLWLWPFAYYGGRAAHWLFGPRDPTVRSSEALDLLQTARATAGFAVILGVAGYYGDTETLDALGSGRSLLQTIIVGFSVLLPVFVLFLVRTRAEARLEMLGRFARYPLVSVVVFTLAYLALFLLSDSFHLLGPHPDRWYVYPLVLLALVPTGGFLAGFTFWSLFMVAKHVFNAADVHPLLPCVCAPVAHLVIAAVSLGQLGGPAPTWVSLTLIGSGVASVTGLSVAEWHHLRRHHDVTIRAGPHPAGRGTP